MPLLAYIDDVYPKVWTILGYYRHGGAADVAGANAANSWSYSCDGRRIDSGERVLSFSRNHRSICGRKEVLTTLCGG